MSYQKDADGGLYPPRVTSGADAKCATRRPIHVRSHLPPVLCLLTISYGPLCDRCYRPIEGGPVGLARTGAREEGITMPRGRNGPRQGSGNIPRKRDKQDVQMRQEIICTAVQGMLRVILDAILWWIDRGGRL